MWQVSVESVSESSAQRTEELVDEPSLASKLIVDSPSQWNHYASDLLLRWNSWTVVIAPALCIVEILQSVRLMSILGLMRVYVRVTALIHEISQRECRSGRVSCPPFSGGGVDGGSGTRCLRTRVFVWCHIFSEGNLVVEKP